MNLKTHSRNGMRVIGASVLQTLAPMFWISKVVADEHVPSLACRFQARPIVRFLCFKKAMLQEQGEELLVLRFSIGLTPKRVTWILRMGAKDRAIIQRMYVPLRRVSLPPPLLGALPVC